jgi:hypothetical protein
MEQSAIFEHEIREADQLRENDGAGGSLIADGVPDILDGGIIDCQWSELERVDRSIMPTGFLNQGLESVSEWNIDALLTSCCLDVVVKIIFAILGNIVEDSKTLTILFCRLPIAVLPFCQLPRGQFISAPYSHYTQ